MHFVHLRLQNWRNFLSLDMPLGPRVFLVGPNASGKSNLLDVFRFLRDVADPDGGGLQRAVHERHGVSQLRSLHARRNPTILIEADMDLGADGRWTYQLEFHQDSQRKPMVKTEKVQRDGEVVLDRPDKDDRGDRTRLTQTYLEQVTANKGIRPIASFLTGVHYLHLVPQLVRRPELASRQTPDPFGTNFLERLARTPTPTRKARLKKITRALQAAVPQLTELELGRDSRGTPHLRGRYEHWRANAGWQTEDELSDGTLRLLGLLWAFLDGTGPLLLEEPELSLHVGIVRHVPGMMATLGRKTGRQILLSTHSVDLLRDDGIAPEEVFLLTPTAEGSRVQAAAEIDDVRALLEGGVPIGQAVLPHTEPEKIEALRAFGG